MEAKLLPFKGVLPERVSALRLAQALSAKNVSELRSIKFDNPILFAAWIEELSHWRERSEREIELLRETERTLLSAD